MACIIADCREQNGAIPHFEACIAENNRHNQKLPPKIGGGDIKYSEEQLTIGDYCVLIPSKNQPNTNILAAIFERKTWKDLSASLKDDRMKEQQKGLNKIREKKDCFICFIIEGPIGYADSHKIANIPFKNLHAKLRHNLIRGFPYVQTKDAQQTAHFIVNFTRDIAKLYSTDEISFIDDLTGEERQEILEHQNAIMDIKRRRRPEKTDVVKELTKSDVEITLREIEASDSQEVDIETMLNLKLIKAGDSSVPVELKTRRIHSDTDIIEKMWESIPGVSGKTAPILMNKYTLSYIICADQERVEELKEEISELKYASGMKLGVKKAAKILEIAYRGENTIKREKAKAASVKLISRIPNVTQDTAEIIVENFSLCDICNGDVSPDAIAELKKNKTRRIGSIVADRIVSILQKSINDF